MDNKKTFKKSLRWLDEHFEETLLIVFLVLIAVVELAQVIIRKLPFVPALTWAEEFCRFLWIGSVFISLSYSVRTETMLRVTALGELLSEKARERLDIAVDIAVLAAMGLCAAVSLSVVRGIAGSGERSPAMLWPMWIVYSVMPVGFGLATLRSLQTLIRHIEKRGR